MSIFAQDTTELPAPNTTELPVQTIEKEAPAEIMGFSLGDSDVSLFLTGSWKGNLQTNLGYSFSPLGDAPVSPETPLLFTQEVDLTLSLWLKERWFVEANFLDESSLNTYRAGYQGRAGEFVQYAGIGNTGLDFPSFAYLDLGGDSPSSFGYYGHFNSGNFNIYSLFRYDAAAREEKVFSGGRERTYSFVQPDNPVRGISFVLPDTDIDSDILVYIEDEAGSIRDDGGRRWRLAGPSEFAAGRTHGLLELGSSPNGMVAVVYSKGVTAPWRSSMGNYNGLPGDFLFDVQQWFDTVKLENYPQCGNGRGSSATPGEISFNGTPALVVFEPGTFSPFERQSRYESPSSMSEEAALVRFSTGNTVREYELVPLETSIRVSDIPVFTAVETRRFLYELLNARTAYDSRDPSSRWPLAQYPDTQYLDTQYLEIYLPGKTGFTGDIALRFTNFSGSGGYSIGVDVIPGSIQVWRSGIQDPNFRYNPSSGEISLSVPAGANELIRVTYLKRSDETRLGSVAAGLGTVYNKPSSPFSLSAAMGIRWNLTGDSSFSEEDVSSPGTIGLSSKAALEYDNLKAHISAGLAFEQQDTTGLYRAAGMEGNEITLAMPPQTSFISNPPAAIPPNTALDISSRADLVYRNYRNSNIAGSTLMPIDWGGSNIVSGQSRPYPARDPLLGSDTQVMVAEFTLNNSRKWTGFQIPLGFDGGVLAGSREIEIPFRFYGFNLNAQANFKVTVQIGSLSGEDFAFNENVELVWERILFTNDWASIPPDPNAYYLNADFNHNSRIARFVLTDEDRLKLGDAGYLRIIVEYDGSGANASAEAHGRVLLAPPVVRGSAFRAVTFDGSKVQSAADFSESGYNNVKALETIEREPEFLESVYGDLIRRLHSAGGKQRVLMIEWENMQGGISAGADGRLGALPLENYRELSFFVKGPRELAVKNEKLSFFIAPGPASVSNSELEAHIPLRAFKAGKWSKVTIRYRGNNTGVSVDGRDEGEAGFRYKPARQTASQSHFAGDEAPKGRAGYAAFFITPDGPFSALEDGSVCIDEIILEDASLVYRLNAGAGVEFKKPGAMISLGNTPLLADFLVSAALESEFRGDPAGEARQTQEALVDGSMMNRSRAEISVLGAKITGNLALTAAKDTFLWSADHDISRDLGPFSVKESFFASPAQDSAGHSVKLGFTSPFSAAFGADMKQELSRLERRWNLGFGFKASNVYIPSFSVNTRAAWTGRDEKIDEGESYTSLWARTWEPLLPDAGADADGRKTSAQITLTEATKPIGFTITLNGSTDFFNANNITRSENSAFLDVPLVFGGESSGATSLNFRMGRSFGKHLSFSGDDALDDGGKLLESIADSFPLWRIAPFYSLFSDDLDGAMDESHKSSPSFDSALYSSFRDHFGIRGAFPSVYNLAAFAVPSTASFRIERVLEQKLDTRADMLNIGSSLGFSAINMFGVMGYLPLFKFYRSDEFTNGLEAAFIIPREEEASWRLQAVTGAGFYGFSGGQLNFTNTLTLRSDESWLESVKGEWTVPTKKSLLSVIYGWIAKTVEKQNSWLGLSSLLKTEFEQLRCESVEFSLEKYKNSLDEGYYRWKLSLGHESIIRILGRLNLSAFAKLNFREDAQQNHAAQITQAAQLNSASQNDIFVFDALLGIALRVSF